MLQIFKKSLILGLSICLIIPVAEAKGAKGKVVSSILSGSKNKLTLLSNQDLAKKEQRLNKKQREGKNFTSLGKQIVREKNVRQNNGVLLCNNCGIKTVLAKKHTKEIHLLVMKVMLTILKLNQKVAVVHLIMGRTYAENAI